MAITFRTTEHRGGGVTVYHGAITHTAGAAEETFKLGSARVQSLRVANMDTGAKLEQTRFSESVSGGTNTVTVHMLNTVADGRIEVVAYAGS